jgi:hypothetical protein
MATFLGMRGTGDWVTNDRPEDWRQGILREFPNGMMPLTAIMSMMGKQRTMDPTFHWWTKTLPRQGGAVTNIYTDVGLSSAYASGGVAGDTLYVKCAEAVSDDFRAGHNAVLRYAGDGGASTGDPDVDVNTEVVDVVKNGANSYIAVKLLEDDDNSTSYDLSDADTILVSGSMQAEGADMPDALVQNPVEYSNYTQIFETAIDLTRTAMRTKLRTEDSYKEAKRDALEYHGIEMEKALLRGVAYSGTGDNGKPKRATQGWVNFIKTNAASNVFNYKLDTGYSGQSWIQSGEEWLDASLETIFRYGDSEKLGVCGSGALLGINRLAKSGGFIQIEPRTAAYGLEVRSWITPFGVLHLKTHPLFSYEATDRYRILVVEPRHGKFRFIDDTFFKGDSEKDGGANSKDGKNESWLTEGGYEFHFPNRHGILDGVGLDNAV